MISFWWLIVSSMIGGCIGIFVMSLVAMSKSLDLEAENLEHEPFGEKWN